MECGEIDFSNLLDEQRGKPLNMNFVGLYWQQVSRPGKTALMYADVASCSSCAPGECGAHRLETSEFRLGQRSSEDHRLWNSKSYRK